jgi:molybdenum cofactor cytidylyltransferase
MPYGFKIFAKLASFKITHYSMNPGNCSVVILAAGSSLRMGDHKFALELRPGLTFLEHIIRQYKQFGCGKIIVVVNPDGMDQQNRKGLDLPVGTRIVVNPVAETGRFSSVKAGLQHSNNANPVFIHNVDNPFSNQDTLTELLKNFQPGAYVCPIFEGKGGHPVLISSEVVKAILVEKSNHVLLKDFLKDFEKIPVQVQDPHVLVNFNTREDLEMVKAGRI